MLPRRKLETHQQLITSLYRRQSTLHSFHPTRCTMNGTYLTTLMLRYNASDIRHRDHIIGIKGIINRWLGKQKTPASQQKRCMLKRERLSVHQLQIRSKGVFHSKRLPDRRQDIDTKWWTAQAYRSSNE